MFEELYRQQEKMQMEAEAFTHDVYRMVEELKPEQLVILRKIFAQVVVEQGTVKNPTLAAYMEGLIAGALRLKYDVCAGCGGSHVENLIPPQEEPPAERDRGELATEYGVFFDKDGTAVRCNSCGFTWISLEDRMLRPPGVKGCENCQHRAKWG